MMHDAPVLAVALSPDGALAASGDRDGHVKVWRLATGALLRALDPPSADGAGVTALAFSPDGGQLAIASYDGVARVAGLKSGRVLRELRGHASFVLAVAYTPDGGTLVTGSADGTLRTWDARTGEAGLAVVPPRAATARAGAPDAPVVAVLPHPTDPGVVVVATRAPCLHIVNVASGAILATLATGKADGGDVVAAALSSRGGFAHALAEDGVLYSFNTGTRLLDGVLTVVEAGADGKLPPPIGVACHPGRNVAATWGADGAVKLWDAGSG
jgi:WD40 repeat-containing protein SMU1